LKNKVPRNVERPVISILFVAAVILTIVIIQPPIQAWDHPGTPSPVRPTQTTTPAQSPTPTDAWASLFQRTPLAYTTPLPPPESTVLDGPYARFDPDEPQWWNCMRCEDYLAAGGIWRLNLDQGVFRIFYEVTSWKSLASYAVTDDRFYIFNDPYCPKEVGVYRWRYEDEDSRRGLELEVIEDECATGLRGRNLSKLPWLSCLPPNTEAAVTDHWQKPPGCEA
jgi:hypothetical protein